MSQEKYFYKYKGVSNRELLDKNIENILNNEFYAASKEQLNDPNEFYIDDRTIQRYIDDTQLFTTSLETLYRVTKEMNKTFADSSLDTLLNEMEKTIPRMKEEGLSTSKSLEKSKHEFFFNNYQTGVFSLTDRHDNELMWAHYAESHKGFAIQYYHKAIVNEKGFFRVEYRNTPPILKNIIDKVEGLSTQDMLREILGVKSESWRYENEVRIVLDTSGNKSFDAEKAIAGIYFGANIDDETEEYIYKKLQGLDLSFYKMVPKQGSYKLEAISYKA